MKRLWLAFAATLMFSFLVLGWIGTRIYQEMPPIPSQYVTTDGTVLVDASQIAAGQNVWQSLGGMEVGSIWGHGSYVAPDWSADWLHREATFVLEAWAKRDFAQSYDELSPEQQRQLVARLKSIMRENSFDQSTGIVMIDPIRAAAFEANVQHYTQVFVGGNEAYAIPENTVSSPERIRALSAFFFWTSWASVTQRPGDIASYTNNWPHEPLVGNLPTGDNIVTGSAWNALPRYRLRLECAIQMALPSLHE